MTKRKSSGLKKFLIVIVIIIIAGAAIIGYDYYKRIYSPNVSSSFKSKYFYINTGYNFDDVLKSMQGEGLLINTTSFKWLSEKMKYTQKVLPGRYRVKPGMSNKELVGLLRSGKQEPVKVVFNNIRTKEQLAGRIAQQIEADSASLMEEMTNDSVLRKLDLNHENVLVLFIPNTYEFYWNTSATEFVERMAKEYEKFWTAERTQKALQLGLKKSEISVLASIVQQETNKKDEKPRVAGVYLNRLKSDRLLEADPTLVYACRDFTIKRVLNIHKEIESPYNTYKYKGLPPGPISMPSAASIDAVLNHESHKFIYFCAKEDLSGYHNFAITLDEHMANARRFHNELNRRKIK